MNKKPVPPSRTADQFVLRLPNGMRDRIAVLAKANNRSMNAEIVKRLEWALALPDAPQVEQLPHPAPSDALSYLMAQDVQALAGQSGVPYHEMLATLVLAGLHKDAPQVLYLPILPGATTKEMRAALEASKDIVRPDATIVSEMLQRAPWIPPAVAERYGVIEKRDEATISPAPRRIPRTQSKKP